MTLKPRRTRKPFLEKLDTATTKKDCGMYLFEGFLSPKEAKDAFDVLVDDAKFPWDREPELNGEPRCAVAEQGEEIKEESRSGSLRTLVYQPFLFGKESARGEEES